jgi:hypothetical protein
MAKGSEGPRLTLKAVNAALAGAGHAERLVKGRDYWYFAEGDTPRWPVTMVCVYHLNALSLDEWLEEHADLKAGAR